MGNVNIVELSLILTAWVMIGWLAYRLSKKQEEKVNAWKIVLLLLGGLFSFSVTFPTDDGIIRVAILPLGVMILSFILRKKKERWSVYRKYAWLGFWANYIFLATSLLSSPIHSALYPEDQADTYIAALIKPTITIIHPSGEEKSINQKEFERSVSSMTQQDFPPLDWYYEAQNIEHKEPNVVSERFPYVLNGIQPKWGSGIQLIVYLERDGKGIMVSTPKGQHYFRSEHVLFKEVVKQ